MFDHEIARTGADVQQRWLRIPAAIAYSGLPRSSLYRLLSQRVIKSASLCSPGKTRGVRIVDRLELDAVLSKLTKQSATSEPKFPWKMRMRFPKAQIRGLCRSPDSPPRELPFVRPVERLAAWHGFSVEIIVSSVAPPSAATVWQACGTLADRCRLVQKRLEILYPELVQ
jgi:hypothetical protein